jgi:F420-0:gamma-glutamyl ligase
MTLETAKVADGEGNLRKPTVLIRNLPFTTKRKDSCKTCISY